MNTLFATFYQLELVMKNKKTGWQSRLTKCSPKAGQSDRTYFVAVPMSIANYGSLETLRASAATLTCEICGLRTGNLKLDMFPDRVAPAGNLFLR